MTKLAVIGAGMMGGAIVTGIVEKKILDNPYKYYDGIL